MKSPLSAGDFANVPVRAWGRSVEYSWKEIVRLWPEDFVRHFVEDVDYRAGLLQRVRTLAVEDAFPVKPIPPSAYTARWREVSTSADIDDDAYHRHFGGASSLTGSKLLECYAVGAVAYDLTARIDMAWVWPLLAQGDARESVEAATVFVDLYELARVWYAAIERHEGIDGFDASIVEDYRRGIAATQL